MNKGFDNERAAPGTLRRRDTRAGGSETQREYLAREARIHGKELKESWHTTGRLFFSQLGIIVFWLLMGAILILPIGVCILTATGQDLTLASTGFYPESVEWLREKLNIASVLLLFGVGIVTAIPTRKRTGGEEDAE